MKLYRNAVILIIVLGLLIGAVLVMKNKKAGTDSSASESKTITLTDIKSDDLVKMTEENAGTKFVAEKKGEDWVLKEPTGIKTNSTSLSDLAANSTMLSADEVIEENAADLAAYGLDKPVVLTLTLKDGSEKAIELGSQTPTKDGYYVKMKDSNKVYKLDSYTAEKLIITKNSIRDTALFTLDKEKVNSLSMERDGQIVFSSAKIGDSQWELSAPIKGNANLTAISPMIEALSALTAQEFIEDNAADLGKYGLSTPRYVFEIGAQNEKHKLYLGSEKTKGSDIYARLDDSNEVFTVSESGLTFLDKPLKEIIDVFAYIANIQDVSKIKVEIDGRVDNIEIQTDEKDSEKDKFVLNGRDATVKDENNDQYFRKYYQALIGITLSEIEADAKPQGTPEISITYTLKKSPYNMKVDFISKDAKTYYVMRNNEYTGIVVNKSAFDGEEGVRETYKKLVELMDKQKK